MRARTAAGMRSKAVALDGEVAFHASPDGSRPFKRQPCSRTKAWCKA